MHPPLWEGYSQCGYMVLGPFRSPSEISQGVSNPRHARLKTVAHSGTEKVGGYVVCKVSVASADSPIKDATLAPGALKQGCKATSQHGWQSLNARLLGETDGDQAALVSLFPDSRCLQEAV